MSDWRLYSIIENSSQGATTPIELRLEVAGGATVDAIATPLEYEIKQRLSERRAAAADTGIVVSLPSPLNVICFTVVVQPNSRVICFILLGTSETEQLDSFRTELLSFVSEHRNLITNNNDASATTPQLSSILSKWHDNCVGYMPRCISSLSLNGQLSLTIQESLIGLQPSVINSSSSLPFKSDVFKLSSALCVIPKNNNNNQQQQQIPSTIPIKQNTTTTTTTKTSSTLIDLLGDEVIPTPQSLPNNIDPIISPRSSANQINIPEGIDPICEEFSKWLTNAIKSDPLVLRGIIEKIKLTASKELNGIRKLLAQSQTSHHALWNCITTLKESPARRIISGLLSSDTLTVPSQEALNSTIHLMSELDSQPIIIHSHSRLY